MKNNRLKLLAINFSILCIVRVQGQTIVYERHDIETNFDGIKTVKIIDLDNDGDLDIVGGSEITPTTASKGVAWWRNNGNNTWERFTIDVSFIHVMSVDVADIDNDGFPDIVATSWQLNQVAWWNNNGDPTQTWAKNIIRSNYTNAHDAKCADIDSDGDIDVIAASYGLGRIEIYFNDGSSPVNWQSSILISSFSGALGLSIKDLDKDGDMDILGTASDAGLISWWENSGSNPINWSYHNIASNFVGSNYLCVVDINQDGLYDVIGNAWSSNQVAYWICNNLQNNSWTKHILTSQLPTAAGVGAGDLDRDGDVDIVAVGKIPGEVGIYQNYDFIWTKILLTNDFYGGENVEVLDMDGDEDLDIVAAGSSGKLVWWENETVVGVLDEDNELVPQKFSLGQNYPNPFNPTTRISYSVKQLSFVTLKVYDVLGNEVTTLVNEEKPAGEYEIEFNGNRLTSIIYLYRMQVGDFADTKKMILIK